jgi:hypothetical protein
MDRGRAVQTYFAHPGANPVSEWLFGLPTFTADVEIYPNFGLIGFRDLDLGTVQHFSTEPGIGSSLQALRQWFAAVKDKSLFVTFKGVSYDNKMLEAMLHRVDDPAKLYALSQQLIGAKRMWCEAADGEISVDLLAFNGGKNAKLGSLKECGIKLDYPKLQELPYPFDQPIDHAQMVEVAAYNINDLEITAGIARLMHEVIDARLVMSTEYGTALFNRHDASLAERVMQQMLFAGDKPSYPAEQHWAVSGHTLCAGFSYHHPELQALLDRIQGWHMVWAMTETVGDDGEVEKSIDGASFSDAVNVAGIGSRLGVGGLHSTDEPSVLEADENWRLLDFDVSSFYPALIMVHRLAPAHLDRDAFLAAFDGLRQRRLTAKKTGQKALAAGLKIAVNSVFGKTKLAYSWLLDPVMSVTITVRGQLTLLKFVDVLADIAGIEVVSANTDGVTVRVRREYAEVVTTALHELSAEMGYELDLTEYRGIWRRDINNYVAVTLDGEVKARGAYARDASNLAKKAINRVVIRAVQQLFIAGVAVEDTIRGCQDIAEFCDYFKCSKGYVICDDAGTEYGGICRWYLGAGGVHLDKRKLATGGLTQLVEGNACVVADLPATIPGNVDYAAYVAMATDLVDAVLNPAIRVADTIPHAELSGAQRELLCYAQTDTTLDLTKLEALDLTREHADYARVHKGNRYDSMKSLLVRLWLGAEGRLTVAELAVVRRGTGRRGRGVYGPGEAHPEGDARMDRSGSLAVPAAQDPGRTNRPGTGVGQGERGEVESKTKDVAQWSARQQIFIWRNTAEIC